MERRSLNKLMVCEVDCATSCKSRNRNMRMRIVSEKSVFFLSILFLLSIHGFSQSKYEKEFRIKAENAPAKALSFVDSLTFDSKVKWYKEIGLDHLSIEAKAKFNNERHSIEFSENGTFQDAEIEVKPHVLPDSTNSKITGVLAQRHKKYKIDKIQIQYTGDRNVVLNFLRENRKNSEGITINYEVVISTKMEGNYLMLEYLFSETGEFLQASQIISRRKDTIDY